MTAKKKQAFEPRSVTFALWMACVLCAPPVSRCVRAAETDPYIVALQTGLLEEEVNLDLDAAIQAYRSIIERHDTKRRAVATALFRLAECYRKQGETDAAVTHYRRVIREFADQEAFVGLSRTNVALLVGPPPGGTGGVARSVASDRDARYAEARALLQREIDLVKGQLEEMKQRVQMGVISTASLVPVERELLSLKRELVQLHPPVGLLDIGLPEDASSTDTPTPDEAKSLKEEMALVEQLIAEADARYRNGRASAREVSGLRGQLLVLQLQLPENSSGEAQRELIEEQRKLLEKVLAIVERQVEVGVAPPSAVIEAKRNLIAFDRELAAVEARAALATAGSLRSASPVAREEAEEIARLREMTRNSPDLLNAPGEDGLTPLQAAASKGQLEVVRFLLETNADIDGRGSSGAPALHYAVAWGHNAVARQLLADGADVNSTGPNGFTPLHWATGLGHRVLARTLLEAKADPNRRTTDTINRSKPSGVGVSLRFSPVRLSTPLHFAARNGAPDLARLLLAAGADVNAVDERDCNALHSACYSGSLELVELLLEAGADIRARTQAGETPLLAAVGRGNADLIEPLLAAGSDVDMANNNGWTPLHYAAERNSTEIVEMLLAAGAEVDQRVGADRSDKARTRPGPVVATAVRAGDTPLQIAVRKDSAAVAAVILGYGPDLSILDGHRGYAALHLAVSLSRIEITEMLLAAGADVDQPDASGSTTLALAIGTRSVDLVRLLLRYEPVLDQAISGGATPIRQAVQDGAVDIADLLLSAGADPNLRLGPNVAGSYEGTTVLHVAVQEANVEMVRCLLRHGAKVNVVDKAGKTPLAYALPDTRSGSIVRRVPPNLRSGTGVVSRAAKLSLIADLLREAGADDAFHLRDVISVRRPNGRSAVVVRRHGSDVNRFSLMEVIALLYRINSRGHISVYQFPDLGRLVVHRLNVRTGERELIGIDFAEVLNSGFCERDFLLEWGDIVELPERDHLVNERWSGLKPIEMDTLSKCVSRSVSVHAHGQETIVHFKVTSRKGAPGSENGFPVFSPFWLENLIHSGRFLRTSSDLSQVKVKRTAPETGNVQEMTFDLRVPDESLVSRTGVSPPVPARVRMTTAPGQAQEMVSPPRHAKAPLWLRDGDVIEIPEKEESPADQAEPPSGVVRVLGQVNQPGVLEVRPDQKLDIIDAIARVGGLKEGARRQVEFTRDGQTRTLSLDELKHETDPEKKIWLRPGDTIEVERPVF